MKVWVNAIPWNKQIVIDALESGADGLIVEKGKSAEVKKLGIITTVAEDGDLKPGEDIFFVEILSKRDEEEIVSFPHDKPVVVKTKDWTIIPIENILAQRSNIFLEVNSLSDAMTASGILEKGVDGVVLSVMEGAELRDTVSKLKKGTDKLVLVEAEISRVIALSMGDRVCIDTCTAMQEGQGMLVGNSSSGMFLVHAETVENPYVAPRPFRVNAGPVHAYIKTPGGKTKYLSELQSGDPVLVVGFDGSTQDAVVGRVKIEKRPLVFVEAFADGKPYTTVLQNAETIRLTSPSGKPVSVVELKESVKVLMFTEKGGRHFGMQVEETIEEK